MTPIADLFSDLDVQCECGHAVHKPGKCAALVGDPALPTWLHVRCKCGNVPAKKTEVSENVAKL